MDSKFFCFIVLLYTTMLKKERTKKKNAVGSLYTIKTRQGMVE